MLDQKQEADLMAVLKQAVSDLEALGYTRQEAIDCAIGMLKRIQEERIDK